MSKHPAEIVAAIVGFVGALVTAGVLDEPTAAWITAGVGLVAAIVTAIVEFRRSRSSA